ncbi:MAG TPA: class I SAM-dependent methyltransferase [Terriglobia bacterium]|nr:class I SAM-dependent methyltransferase [Terriglobia bacterium]
MKPQQEKPTTFDRYAGDYAALLHDPLREKFAASNRFFFERKIQVIRRFFKNAGIKTQNLAWLDIGCGQGDMLRAGQGDFSSATGCDPSEGMLQACSGLQVRRQESLEELPFNSGSFDFVTAVCVYHHVPRSERRRLTREALRVVKPSGIFCVIEHNPWNVVTRVIVSRTPVDADAKLLSAPETRRLLSEAGSNVLSTHYFLVVPEAIHRYFGRIEDALGGLPLGGQYSVFAKRLA